MPVQYPVNLNVKVHDPNKDFNVRTLPLSSTEYQERREQLAKIDIPVIIYDITFNWPSVIEPLAGEVDKNNTVLPYDDCVFNLKYMSHPVSVRVIRVHEDSPEWEIIMVHPYISEESLEDSKAKHVDIAAISKDVLVNEIKYILIALESKICKLEAHVGSGKVPRKANTQYKGDVFYHYVVKETREKKSSGNKTDIRQRLHFRSGHWRHKNGTRTRIPWCFAGDPALGIIDKNYRITNLLKKVKQDDV